MVKVKTEAKQAKEAKAKDNKEKRAQAKKDKISAANGLGANMCASLTSQAQVEKLKVPELKACLTFRGVPLPKQAKKSDLIALLVSEIDLPVNPPPAPSGEEEEVDAAAFIDSSDEGDSADSESEDEAGLKF